MKIIFPLIALTMLTSCGEKKSSKSGINMDAYRQAMTPSRGQSANEFTEGSTLSFNESGRARKVPQKKKSLEIVLKIEGKKRYVYKEEKNLMTGEVEREVRMDDEDPTVGFAEAIREGKIQIVGDYAIMNYTEASNNEWGNGVKYFSTIIVKGKANVSKPMCEFNMSVAMKDGRLEQQDGTSTAFPDTESTIVSTCGEILSAAKLKAIDLTNISFCEETAEDNYDCSEQDMGHLTADL